MNYLALILQLLPGLVAYRQARGSKDPIESAVEALVAITPVLQTLTKEEQTDEKEIQTHPEKFSTQVQKRRS